MARKGHGRPANLVNITTHPDDGTSPVGSNEWNANRDTTGIIGFTKKTESVTSNSINITDSYVEVTSSGNEEIRTMVQVTDALSSTNYASDTTTKSFAEGDLLYLVKANAGHVITLKHQYGSSAGAGKITTLTGGDLLLDVKVPRIFICRTIGSNQEWIEYGGGTASNLDTTNFTAATIVTESDTITGNDNDTTLPTSAAVKDYVDTQITAEDLDTAGDSGTGAIDLNSQSLAVTGGTGITTTASNQAISIVADDATASAKGVVELATTAELDTGTDTTRAVTVAGIEASARSVKLDAIEASADVTDTTNVNAAAATTVGTITSGTWQGTTVAVDQGGTGVTSSTGTGSTVLSASPTLTGTVNASAITLSGDLTVNGSTTTVNTATLSVEDPLIKLASGNNAADSVDVGFYGLYDVGGTDKYAGIVRDASDSGKFIAFKDLQTEPTTTVDKSATGYAVATIVANIEGNVTGSSGTCTGLAGSASTAVTVSDNAIGITQLAGIARGKIIVGDASGNPALLTVGAEDTVLTVDASGDVGWEAPAGGATLSYTPFANNQSTTYTGSTDTSPTRYTSSGVGVREIYIKRIDANNEGVFTKIFKNGSATEVQIA
jgi:hypothetical protein